MVNCRHCSRRSIITTTETTANNYQLSSFVITAGRRIEQQLVGEEKEKN
jgi:L-lysine 2,3-aminomutase